MKASSILTAAILVGIVLTMASFGRMNSASAPEAIPDSVYAVLEKSCLACHSDNGNGLAKGKVNFEKWDSYTAGKKADKAAAISKVVTKGVMPPSGFRKNNPDRVPTEADIAIITAWTKQFQP